MTLRSLFSKVPAPVSILTTNSAHGTRCCTVSSFNTVSLDPPTFSFNIRQPSRLSDLLLKTNTLSCNLLTTGQSKEATHYSKSDKLISHLFDFDSSIVIVGSLATLKLEIIRSLEVGDHVVYFCRVTSLIEFVDSSCLLHYKQNYFSIDSTQGLNTNQTIHALFQSRAGTKHTIQKAEIERFLKQNAHLNCSKEFIDSLTNMYK